MVIREEVGSRLRELRTEKSVSQQTVGEAAGDGAGQSTVSAWERGVRSLDGEQRAKLAEFFGVDESELAADEGDGEPDGAEPEGEVVAGPIERIERTIAGVKRATVLDLTETLYDAAASNGGGDGWVGHLGHQVAVMGSLLDQVEKELAEEFAE